MYWQRVVPGSETGLFKDVDLYDVLLLLLRRRR
jgi:hypothetical protein